MIHPEPVLHDINLPGVPFFKKGKVRHVYDLGEHLLIVASDRVSAFDVILPTCIPGKGRMLTQISTFWFNLIAPQFQHHVISTDVDTYPDITHPYKDILRGRSMLVRKTTLIPVECVVRGYLIGTGWKEYQEHGTVCGITLPKGLQMADRLPEPIFTPAFKAEDGGHDENITFDRMIELVGKSLAEELRKRSLALYNYGRDYAAQRGIILADTKFEFGTIGNDTILIDEVLTPDSSRYWPASEYRPGISPPSFDKQIIRDYLETLDWNKQAPGPELPQDIVEKVAAQYANLQALLTHQR